MVNTKKYSNVRLYRNTEFMAVHRILPREYYNGYDFELSIRLHGFEFVSGLFFMRLDRGTIG